MPTNINLQLLKTAAPNPFVPPGSSSGWPTNSARRSSVPTPDLPTMSAHPTGGTTPPLTNTAARPSVPPASAPAAGTTNTLPAPRGGTNTASTGGQRNYIPPAARPQSAAASNPANGASRRWFNDSADTAINALPSVAYNAARTALNPVSAVTGAFGGITGGIRNYIPTDAESQPPTKTPYHESDSLVTRLGGGLYNRVTGGGVQEMLDRNVVRPLQQGVRDSEYGGLTNIDYNTGDVTLNARQGWEAIKNDGLKPYNRDTSDDGFVQRAARRVGTWLPREVIDPATRREIEEQSGGVVSHNPNTGKATFDRTKIPGVVWGKLTDMYKANPNMFHILGALVLGGGALYGGSRLLRGRQQQPPPQAYYPPPPQHGYYPNYYQG